MPELNHERSALSLVIYKKGRVTPEDIEKLLARHEREKRYTFDRNRYYLAVKNANAHYWSRAHCVFVCTAEPCQKRTIMDQSPDALAALSTSFGCPVELTGCHWQCDEAPAVTLKSGDTQTHFVECSSPERWEQVQSEIKQLLTA